MRSIQFSRIVCLVSCILFLSVPAFAYEDFPTTSILDNFNRTTEGPPPSSNWAISYGGDVGGFKVSNNQCVVDSTRNGISSCYWKASPFGPDTEVYTTVIAKPASGNQLQLALRVVNITGEFPNGYAIELMALAGIDEIRIVRFDDGVTTTISPVIYEEFKAGDKIGLSMVGSQLTAYRYDGSSWFELVTVTDNTYSSASVVVANAFDTTAVLDDFGGGTTIAGAHVIYRSVGPDAAGAIATGKRNALTISGTTATFEKDPGADAGIGDVIQYDADNDGDIDGSDAVVFIHSRVSDNTFTVATATGGAPRPVVKDNEWSMFRAYTSLANAESGIENTGISEDIRNFDDWTNGGTAADNDAGRDLAAHGEKWHIVCYANGNKADTSPVRVDGWITSPANPIEIYSAPAARHNGVWDTGKYHMALNNDYGIYIGNDHVHVDGLQIELTKVKTDGLGGILSANTDTQISRCLIRYTGKSYDGKLFAVYGADLGKGGTVLKVWNNAVYGFNGVSNEGISFDIKGSKSAAYVYNNTVYGCSAGYRDASGKNQVLLINNIAFGNADNYVATAWHSESRSNLSGPSQADAPGANAQNTAALSFTNTTAGSEDFHLSPEDRAAMSAGVNLTADANLAFSDDAEGEMRPIGLAWDIGADERLFVPEISEEIVSEEEAAPVEPQPAVTPVVQPESVAEPGVEISPTDPLTNAEKSSLNDLIEKSSAGGAQLYDVVIKLGNNTHSDPEEDARASYKEGDVVVVRPAGHNWSETERNSFLIIQLNLTEQEAEELVGSKQVVTGKVDESGRPIKETVKRRAKKIDLKKLGLNKAGEEHRKLKDVKDALKGKALKKDKVIKLK